MTETNTTTQGLPKMSFGQTVVLGWKVLLSEIHWHILRGLRLWEIRQIEQRLQKEYQTLGRLLSSQDKDKENEHGNEEVEFCQKQIDFLAKEIEFLKQELNNLRDSIIGQRCRKWSLT